MFSCTMTESSGLSNSMSLAIETQPSLASHPLPSRVDPSRGSMESASCVNSIEEIIEESKSHWSQLSDFDSDNEVAEVSNMELFKTLKANSTWDNFFMTFGKSEDSYGELVMGEKFAEGGQAEIYEVQVKWDDPEMCEEDLNCSNEYVLKVFKKGTFLRHLQSQWPQGMLQFHVDRMNYQSLGLSSGIRFHCEVYCGTLLEDGRFAFLMLKEKEDLRILINHQMLTRSNNKGPFSNKEAIAFMHGVACGMNQLHDRGIVHRDIKASNVLLSSDRVCFIADFECFVGVVGTGFFRAPEILEACKHGNESRKAELFTKAADVYSYGMTCYEILTGKLPFEGHPWKDYNLVLQGQRPKLPNYIHGWIKKLLKRCWNLNPNSRPTSQEILKILRANSATCRYRDLIFQKVEIEQGIRKALDRNLMVVDMWRSFRFKLKLLKVKRLSLCRK